MPLRCVPADLDVTLYMDASGPADEERHWACVVAKNDGQRRALRQGLRRLRARYPDSVVPETREPKRLSSAGLVDAIQMLHREGLVFGSYPVPAWDDPSMRELATHLSGLMGRLRPNPSRPDSEQVARRQRRIVSYLTQINDNPRNQHKLVSVLAFCNRVVDVLRKDGVTRRLRRVTLYSDNENFRVPRECAWAVKWLFAGVLQGAGMDVKSTGGAPFETGFGHSVRVRMNCPSHRFAGLQFADIVARAARRGVLTLMG